MEEVTVSTGYQQFPKERGNRFFAIVDNKLLIVLFHQTLLAVCRAVPGLVFDKNAGNDLGITIRGISTMFISTQPLIIVDNFPYYNDIQ